MFAALSDVLDPRYARSRVLWLFIASQLVRQGLTIIGNFAGQTQDQRPQRTPLCVSISLTFNRSHPPVRQPVWRVVEKNSRSINHFLAFHFRAAQENGRDSTGETQKGEGEVF